MNTKIIFAPGVDEAILEYLDYVEIDDIPQVLNSINRAQKRLGDTLATFPMSGVKFHGNTQYFTISGYVFIYEYDADGKQINVIDLYMPGQNWINR